MHFPRNRYWMTLRQERKWRKRIKQTRIDQRNKPLWDIIELYKKLFATVSKHTREAKGKKSIRKESNKFVNQVDLTPKEIDIKY